jgi:hypothetical protein
VDDVEQVGHGGERLGHERDGCSSSTCSAPPSSNQMMTLSRLGVPARALSVASAARRMSSRAMDAPPTSSPSYSSSSLPVMAGSAANTSAMRGTPSGSPVRTARRSALLTTFSIAVIGMRCDTPERLSTRLSVRASKATRSITSRTSSGTRTGARRRRVRLRASTPPAA